MILAIVRKRDRFPETICDFEELEGREALLEIKEEGAELPKMLSILKDEHHKELVQYYHRGLSNHSISKIWGTSHQAVASVKRTVRKRLAQGGYSI